MCKKTMTCVTVALLLVSILSVGCDEPDLVGNALVPSLRAMSDEATQGVQGVVSDQISNRVGENPVPSAIGTGISATINSLIGYIVNEVVNSKLTG